MQTPLNPTSIGRAEKSKLKTKSTYDINTQKNGKQIQFSIDIIVKSQNFQANHVVSVLTSQGRACGFAVLKLIRFTHNPIKQQF